MKNIFNQTLEQAKKIKLHNWIAIIAAIFLIRFYSSTYIDAPFHTKIQTMDFDRRGNLDGDPPRTQYSISDYKDARQEFTSPMYLNAFQSRTKIYSCGYEIKNITLSNLILFSYICLFYLIVLLSVYASKKAGNSLPIFIIGMSIVTFLFYKQQKSIDSIHYKCTQTNIKTDDFSYNINSIDSKIYDIESKLRDISYDINSQEHNTVNVYQSY